jgi:competence protein ComEC
VALIYLSCAWVAGIVLGFEFDLPLALVFAGLLPLLLLPLKRYRKPLVLASLCLLALFGGAFYSHSQSNLAENENYLGFYNDKGVVEVRGMVSGDPEVGDKTTQLRLAASEKRLNGEWREVKGTALLVVPRYPAYGYGDVLEVTGKLEMPEDPAYADYLAHEGIFSTMFYPQVAVLDTEQGFKPLERLYSLRNRLSQALAQALPQPQASLAQGIILGIRSNIPTGLKEDFSTSSTAHILAISGLHLAIIAVGLCSALAYGSSVADATSTSGWRWSSSGFTP